MTQKTKDLDTVKTNSANGKTPELSEIKISETKKEVKTEEKTFSAVMFKAEKLIYLKEKRERFIVAQEKLNSFVANTTEEESASEFRLTGQDHNHFVTKNPVIIADMVEYAKIKISEHLAEVEKEIMTIF